MDWIEPPRVVLFYEVMNLQIAIDGPAGSGKSTIASRIAEKLSLLHVDSGALYRAITWSLLDNKDMIHDEVWLANHLKHLAIDYHRGRLRLNQEDITDLIRTPDVNDFVSDVAAIPMVRQCVGCWLSDIIASQDVIMDGRDIGTEVMPHATVKIYLNASVEERARRRYEEIKNKELVSLEDIEASIAHRDQLDSTRKDSPLRKADDAWEIDTTHLTIEDVEALILKKIEGQSCTQC